MIEEADDLRLLLRFALGLDAGVEVVDAAPSVDAVALDLDRDHDVDVVLVDHHMGTPRRLATLQAVKQRWPAAAIVLAGARLDADQADEARAAGVGAFIALRGDINEAVAAIRTAAATRPR